MMKKILVSAASKYIHSALAVWYLKAAVPSYDIYECTVNSDIEKVCREIASENPSVVGFSCYIWNISYVTRLAKMLRERLENVKIIFGGPEVSFESERFKGIADYVIKGSGEQRLKELTEAIEKGEDYPFISEGCTCDVPPNPYTEEYFAALKGRIAYIETSRGCPFSCAFCLSGREEKPLFFPLERAFSDVKRLSFSGAKTIKFVDRTFNADRKRAYAIWKYILEDDELPKDICYHFEIGADLLTEENIELLKSAPKGRFQVEIGFQSFNDETLKAVSRTAPADKAVENTLCLVDNSNIHVHTDLIIGLPYEDMESFKKSFDKAYSLKSHMLQVGFLKLLYGSALRKDMGKYSISCKDEPPYEVTKTHCMTESEIEKLKAFEDIVERLKNSGRFEKTVEYLLKYTEKSPFELFMHIAENIEYGKNCSLDDFTAALLKLYRDVGIDLRDILTEDRIESNNTGALPPCLKIYDKRLGEVRKRLKKLCPLKENTVRGCALLYGENSVIFADYTEENYDRVTGRYKSQKMSIDSVMKEEEI